MQISNIKEKIHEILRNFTESLSQYFHSASNWPACFLYVLAYTIFTHEAWKLTSDGNSVDDLIIHCDIDVVSCVCLFKLLPVQKISSSDRWQNYSRNWRHRKKDMFHSIHHFLCEKKEIKNIWKKRVIELQFLCSNSTYGMVFESRAKQEPSGWRIVLK